MSDRVARLNSALSGRYRIVRLLGEGGMATVYLAEDLRHGRQVALKILKPELAVIIGADRFLAEIKTTANLHHPHILPLHDSGEADGVLYYVMPSVEGESLRERLDRERQLPIDEAIRIASDVAEALDYAHRHGVVHRDIKPANILLQDGKPVISDFGIALAVTRGDGGRLTETGLSLGTPHYMSPEQATGDQGVGLATDVWALGCVLHEMLVGEPPYVGRTPHAVLGKIVLAEPTSPMASRKSVPPNVDAAVRKALEKLPADRFESAGAFAKALDNVGFRHAEALATTGAPLIGRWKPLSIGLALGASLAASTGWWMSVSRIERPELARFDVTPRVDQALVQTIGMDLALASDDLRFVYVGVAPGGRQQLWHRAGDDLEAVPVPGTDGASSPALSPDGQSVAFQVAGTIRVVELGGGPPLTVVSQAPLGLGMAWGPDGMIYFGRDRILYRVPSTGGEPVAVTAETEGRAHRWPNVLPDARGVLLTVTGNAPEQRRIAVVGPDGGVPREILTGTMAAYSATGHIVYATYERTLLAAPFDVRRLEVTGASVALLEGVLVNTSSAAQFAVSESGTLLYGTGEPSLRELVWVSREGAAEAVDPTWTGRFNFPALSPDGSQLAVALQGVSAWDVWIKQLDRGPSLKLTFEGEDNDHSTWTPDGEAVTFYSRRGADPTALWTKPADGSGQASLTVNDERDAANAVWSSDGQWLVYTTGGDSGDILAVRPDEGAEPVTIVATPLHERGPTLSPNGRWMAYTESVEAGTEQVVVVPFPNAAESKWLVSPDGGIQPLWSHSGTEIFYRNRRDEMVAVEVRADSTFSFGLPRILFAADGYSSNPNRRQYDVSLDDERFIMIRRAGAGSASEGRMILVQNFDEELRQRVPD